MGYGYQTSPWGMQRPSFGQSLMSGGPFMPGMAGRGAPSAPGILQNPNPIFGGNGVTGWGSDEPAGAAPQRKSFGQALIGNVGDWLKNGDNLLGLAQVGTGVYGAYKQGKAMDRKNEQEQEELEYRRREREGERKRRANADPLRMAIIARLMDRGGQ